VRPSNSDTQGEDCVVAATAAFDRGTRDAETWRQAVRRARERRRVVIKRYE
jgi:hypothetical protein